jgi:hypothetical protein
MVGHNIQIRHYRKSTIFYWFSIYILAPLILFIAGKL